MKLRKGLCFHTAESDHFVEISDIFVDTKVFETHGKDQDRRLTVPITMVQLTMKNKPRYPGDPIKTLDTTVVNANQMSEYIPFDPLALRAEGMCGGQ